ncbi:MAG: hypothetical protein LBN25_00600 [Christensenellaceae bacterium]|jgi:hypothetical protein|nr:hypothetical protein [Christensenellaceae bacterium]
MKRKLIITLVVFAVLLTAALTACASTDNTELREKIKNDVYTPVAPPETLDYPPEEVEFVHKYRDYSEVDFDYEKYPELNPDREGAGAMGVGLFWQKIVDGRLVQYSADTPEGAALIDPDKPTYIYVHGMMDNPEGYPGKFNFPANIGDYADFDLESNAFGEQILWEKAGFNYGILKYTQFTSENPAIAFWNIEPKIWGYDGITSTGTSVGNRFRYVGGKFSDLVVGEFGLAEFFAGEYLRALKLLPDTFGSHEIRVAGHSMGGQLSTAWVWMLTELYKDKWLTKQQLPSRLSILDPFFGMIIDQDGVAALFSKHNVTIGLTGEKLYQNYTGAQMGQCLVDIRAAGLAIEYYVYPMSWLLSVTPDYVFDVIRENAAVVYIQINYAGTHPGYVIATDGHVAANEWYVCSIYFGGGYTPYESLTPTQIDALTKKDLTVPSNPGYVPSALLPTDILYTLAGNIYYMTEGGTTLVYDDDAFVQIQDRYRPEVPED